MGVSPETSLQFEALEGQEHDRQEFDHQVLERHEGTFRLRRPSNFAAV